jgi:uncharacterized protein (UPF0276 family)
MATRPGIGFLEVHAENYLAGGPAPASLATLRRDYPVSLHGVGLSLGSADGIDADHLGRLARLASRVEPFLVSEHLSWNRIGDTVFNDLLPLPYTHESLAIVAANVARAQDALGRTILIENPSRYLDFEQQDFDEPGFLAALSARTGCSILCDLNNIHVSAANLDFDAFDYLGRLPAAAIGQYHLAGHSRNEVDGRTVLIDSHGARVAPAVWRLFARALGSIGPRPTLIEWDSELPPLSVLLDEARAAELVMQTAFPGGNDAVAA